MMKCTMSIPQDHRSTTDLANLTLTLRLREQSSGECQVSQGGLRASSTDHSEDTKKMTYIHASDAMYGDLGGRCLEYSVFNEHVPSGETQMVNVFCYVGMVDDNEPH